MRSATSAGVIPLHVAITGLTGRAEVEHDRSGDAGGAAMDVHDRGVGDVVRADERERRSSPRRKRPMHPPRSGVATGGTSWSPERWKTKSVSVAAAAKLRNVQRTVSAAATRIVAVRLLMSPLLSASSQERSASVEPAPDGSFSVTV